MKLEELLEIHIPKELGEKHQDFYRYLWKRIKSAENQVHLYCLLMHALIDYANGSTDTSMVKNPDALKLMAIPKYVDESDYHIEIAVDPDKSKNVMLEKMRAVWIEMKNKSLETSERDLGYPETIDAMGATAQDLIAKFENETGIQYNWRTYSWTLQELVNYVISGEKLDEDNRISGDRKQIEASRLLMLKIWLQQSRRIKNNKTNNDLAKHKKEGIRFSDSEVEILTDIIKKKGRYDIKDRYDIVEFYTEEKNFNQYIVQDALGCENHSLLLKKILTHPSFSFPTKDIIKDRILGAVMLSLIHKKTSELNIRAYEELKGEKFEHTEVDHIQFISALMNETESLLRDLEFTLSKTWSDLEKSKLKTVKLQKLFCYEEELTVSSVPDSMLLEFPYLYWQISKDEGLKGRRFLVSSKRCDRFFISETGFDHYVYGLSFKYKFDFLSRTIEKEGKTVFSYFGEGKTNGLAGYAKYFKWKYFSESDFLNHIFTFRKKWFGLYHIFMEPGVPDKPCLIPDIVSYKTGFANGIGRADKVADDEYLWTIEGATMSDTALEGICNRMDLNYGNLVDSKAYKLRRIVNENGIMHEFLECRKDGDERYVRVNLPYKNSEMKNEVTSSDVLDLLSRIAYYRKLNDLGKVSKEDQKNNPTDNINLPVCFALNHNYLFLHKKLFNGVDRKRFRKKVWKGASLGMAISSRLSLNSLMRISASQFAKQQFRDKDEYRRNWSVIKGDIFYQLPTDQEWCHLQGHGDGGLDDPANIVCGSYHCNTEQLAIELGQRMSTHGSTKKYLMSSTAYLFDTSIGGNRNSRKRGRDDEAVDSMEEDRVINEHKKRKMNERVKEDSVETKEIELPMEFPSPDCKLASFIRYKIYEDKTKIFDYTFEAQSEFFDRNQFNIVNRVAEFTLKGEDAFKHWLAD